MDATAIPAALSERLGAEATRGLVELFRVFEEEVRSAQVVIPVLDRPGRRRRHQASEATFFVYMLAMPRLPAFAVTAQASARDRERALAAGFDGHIAKPIDPQELARVLAKFRRSP